MLCHSPQGYGPATMRDAASRSVKGRLMLYGVALQVAVVVQSGLWGLRLAINGQQGMSRIRGRRVGNDCSSADAKFIHTLKRARRCRNRDEPRRVETAGGWMGERMRDLFRDVTLLKPPVLSRDDAYPVGGNGAQRIRDGVPGAYRQQGILMTAIQVF
ncbi:hypothetical protein P152DRAFT_155407 [Eremomyces bilateralis CBS 781.70]|uniref:Uncharacterized protein n=1 Tax=Eremomyces bilateralis CBS 781.70 TaxID=1392243 RepID=A0A6G1FVE4_9PEZI|nr:uncharacterized protein P152DRAFT_155407 [Eremomyces bilateralis CBS 781.70]KAF1809631.1 hypothetical protein P152DRAFT_155407 [Eremomyces bilateralis CBS 781.70]